MASEKPHLAEDLEVGLEGLVDVGGEELGVPGDGVVDAGPGEAVVFEEMPD